VREPWQMAGAVVTIVSGVAVYYFFKSRQLRNS
jgi:hypothetical protein